MSRKKLIIVGFALLCLVQLYVPAQMIWEREAVLASGVEYKFKVAPVDPSDPFRGKYIVLEFDNVEFVVEDDADWQINEEVFVQLMMDGDGYAQIQDVLKSKPSDTGAYVKARIRFVESGDPKKLIIEYPFNRFYMEESKAYAAEQAYRESLLDSTSVTYGLVQVKEGEAVLKDVMINGMPIKEVVEERLQR